MDFKQAGIMIAIAIGFSVLDIITGYINAVIKNEVKSSTMRQGLLKKFILLVILFAAALLEFAQGYLDLGIHIATTEITAAFVIIMELTSIFENANNLLDGKLADLISKILPKKNKED